MSYLCGQRLPELGKRMSVEVAEGGSVGSPRPGSAGPLATLGAMRLVFAGTPHLAVATLDALVAAGHDIALVLTRPDAPTGRKRMLTPSPVAARALELGLPLLHARRPGDAEADAIRATGADLGVVVAYGGILPASVLDAPARGWINLHFSLLPAWRGAAPVQRAILAGERTGGVSVFQLEEGLDTGPVYRTSPVTFGEAETSGEALERLGVQGAEDVAAVVAAIADGSAHAEPQRGEPTHAAKLTPADGVVDWTLPAPLVAARILGASPEPGAAAMLGDARIKLHRARAAGDAGASAPGTIRRDGRRVLVDTGDGAVELVEVQPPGKRVMAAADWLRGNAELDGERFS